MKKNAFVRFYHRDTHYYVIVWLYPIGYWNAYVTFLMDVAYKNLSVKSDFSQMHPSRSRIDYEHRSFHSDLIVNEFKQIGLIWSIGLLIMNATNVKGDGL